MANSSHPPHLSIDLKEKNYKLRRACLALGITLNLGTLFYYKYLFWVVSSLAMILGFPELKVHEHALPLGISFFTFHAVSYLVDVYHGKVGGHSAADFAAYFFMFPHLVAGPIVRFEDVRDDLQHRHRDFRLFTYGMMRFMLGVNKKILIANTVAPLADLAFYAHDPAIGAMDAWVGILAYTVQIYFDFSGYSDMAIGLAAMMGSRFKENFQSPYRSAGIREFWRRWHISLSSWLRDYLYIPLGGSRCSKFLNCRNLVIVFVLCGLWHGAQFTFLVWGLWHGMWLIIERLGLGKALERAPRALGRIYCMLAVIVGWVFFRADDLPQALSYLGCMFGLGDGDVSLEFYGYLNLIALGLGLAVACFGRELFTYGKENAARFPSWLIWLNLPLFAVSLMVLYTGSRNPFIYFNF